MNKFDLIMDFETFGQDIFTSPVIDCSVYVFDWGRFLSNPYTFDELTKDAKRFKLSVKDQVENYGCKYTEEDLKFWLTLGKDVKENIKPLPTDLSLKDFGIQFFEYLRDSPKIEHWWSRGNSFEPPILYRMMRYISMIHDLNAYLMFWRVECTRTHINAKFNFPKKNAFVPVEDVDAWAEKFKEHDSKHDIAADILRLQAIHRAENDLPQVKI